MSKKRIHYFVIFPVVVLIFVTSGCSFYPYGKPTTGGWIREEVDPNITNAVNAFRASVPKLMKTNKISGCALALVDEKGILWAEGFGTTDFKRKIPVTPDTLFNIGSISKTFTATAVLLAVQDGVLDLDEPIITYLPDFKVYSRYEEWPESKITLRHLLSHTSGLPHEAVGCNMWEVECTFEDRVKGIHGLWLKCPVGQAFHYSGAGYDLAAHVLRRVSGIPFEKYMAERIFRPLGMPNSTLDTNEIRSNANRAIGHMIAIAKNPSVHGLVGAGGVFTSAADLARLVQYLINRGSLEGNRLLNESLIEAMLSPHVFTLEDQYGLGVFIGHYGGEIEMSHSGGGFGYASFMYWWPKYGVGGLYLANRIPLTSMYDLAIGHQLIRDRRFEARFPEPKLDSNQCVPRWTTWPEHAPSPYKPEWKQYCGTYRGIFSGFKLQWWAKLVLTLGLDRYTPRIKVFKKDGYLCLTESRLLKSLVSLRQVNSRLVEVAPGVFYTASGDVLDFTGENPTWRSYWFKKR